MGFRLKHFITHEASGRNFQMDSLDGLRGVAVFFVLFSHLNRNGMTAIPGLDLSGMGKCGVFLFFILSAFLLTLPFLEKGKSTFADGTTWARYFSRRFLRIFPLFTLILGISFLTTLWLGKRTGGYGFPFTISMDELYRHLTLQQGKSVLWSIPVEFKYYFVLPAVAWVYTAFLKRRLPACLLATAAAVASCHLLWPPSASGDHDVSLRFYLPVFFMGSFSAVVHHRIQESAVWKEDRRIRYLFEIVSMVSFSAILLTTPSIYGSLAGKGIEITRFHRSFILYGILWSIFLLSTLHGRGFMRRLLSLPALRFVGVISFSIYLWHLCILRLTKHFILPDADPMVRGFLVLLAVLAASTCSYLWVEKPFLHMRPGVKRLRRGGVAAVSARQAG